MALDAKNTKHSLANALALAQCSQLAYGSEGDIKKGLADVVGSKLVEFKFLDNPVFNTQGFLAGFEEAIVLCFRGTENVADWLQDGQIALVPFRNIGLIHLGFRNAFDCVHTEVEDTLTAWSGKGRTLWITGHSLGAALAMLGAAYLRFPADPTKNVPKPIAGLYTFGQPRVGTVPYCDAFDTSIGGVYFRYVNNEDIVTRVPPREIGYWHGGRLEYFDRNGDIHDDPAWWQIFLDRVSAGMAEVRRLQLTNPRIGAIKDHAIEDYIAAIKHNMKVIA